MSQIEVYNRRRPPKTRAALAYAQRLHEGQTREADGAPFIVHPREVAGLLADAGASDDLIAAGALHDVIEKTPARACDVRERFGAAVASLVLAVSEDRSIGAYAQRKAALRSQVASAGEQALMLLAADKISKVRELCLVSTRDRATVRQLRGADRKRVRRLVHYRACLRLLEQRLPNSSLVGLLAAELAASEARSPRQAGAGSSETRRGTRARRDAEQPLVHSRAAASAV